jgi:HD-GYP domain-containing protein (c-di-GMP phosphodiesterase class II)
LDGSGYPRGLKQPDIPIQSQMMTIADIYDALTAGDRPYKRGVPVSIALKILRQEAGQNKLNQELVDLFEHRQVFDVLGHQYHPES